MLIFSANVEQVKKLRQIKHIDIVLKSAAEYLHMKGSQFEILKFQENVGLISNQFEPVKAQPAAALQG